MKEPHAYTSLQCPLELHSEAEILIACL